MKKNGVSYGNKTAGNRQLCCTQASNRLGDKLKEIEKAKQEESKSPLKTPKFHEESPKKACK